jgi:hypothetical protein
VSAPVEVPEDIVERVRALCMALPEVTVRVDYSLTRARSTAQSFRELVTDSYRVLAPKKLTARLD